MAGADAAGGNEAQSRHVVTIAEAREAGARAALADWDYTKDLLPNVALGRAGSAGGVGRAGQRHLHLGHTQRAADPAAGGVAASLNLRADDDGGHDDEQDEDESRHPRTPTKETE